MAGVGWAACAQSLKEVGEVGADRAAMMPVATRLS